MQGHLFNSKNRSLEEQGRPGGALTVTCKHRQPCLAISFDTANQNRQPRSQTVYRRNGGQLKRVHNALRHTTGKGIKSTKTHKRPQPYFNLPLSLSCCVSLKNSPFDWLLAAGPPLRDWPASTRLGLSGITLIHERVNIKERSARNGGGRGRRTGFVRLFLLLRSHSCDSIFITLPCRLSSSRRSDTILSRVHRSGVGGGWGLR